MSDEVRRPAGTARQAIAPPPRQAKPVEMLPGDMKTRAPEELRLARAQMHPIQRRPVPSPDKE